MSSAVQHVKDPLPGTSCCVYPAMLRSLFAQLLQLGWHLLSHLLPAA